ncbi:MAG TPA: heavy metal-responsive transcriptional regulator [Blastocatellia bacterium]|nr:heavy metal-responsive transcriptional regulator [Blastocatellia bacterium]
MTGALKIGELALAAGVSADTVRYYERLNLLPRASRTRAGYRLYSNADLERLRFVKQAQIFGFSLDEIKEILPGREAGLSECRRVHDLVGSKLEEVNARLAELRAFRRLLAAYFEECEQELAGKRGDACPVLFEISHPSRKKLARAPERKTKEVFKRKKGVKK